MIIININIINRYHISSSSLSSSSFRHPLFSLFRLTDGTESGNLHKTFSAKLAPIVAHLGSSLDKTQLQKLADGCRTHPSWSAAHLSAHASLEVRPFEIVSSRCTQQRLFTSIFFLCIFRRRFGIISL